MSSPLRRTRERLLIIPTDEFIVFANRPEPDLEEAHYFELSIVTSSQQEKLSAVGELGFFVFSRAEHEVRHNRWIFSGLVFLPGESELSGYRLEWSTDMRFSTGALQIFWTP